MSKFKHSLWVAVLSVFVLVNFSYAQSDTADYLPYANENNQAAQPSPGARRAVGQASITGYTLGSGDLISITVFGEPDLSITSIRLTDAGTFSYPFLGEIRAKGFTSAQVESMITGGLLGDYLVDPKVTVSILEYRPFYVNGEVKNPGGYPFEPGLTVRKAIALAGGFTERASRSKFYIIRDKDPSRPPIQVTLESGVFPGDIITINESFF